MILKSLVGEENAETITQQANDRKMLSDQFIMKNIPFLRIIKGKKDEEGMTSNLEMETHGENHKSNISNQDN